MIQPSIHKRDIESNRMCGALFDMRDLAQMLAHEAHTVTPRRSTQGAKELNVPPPVAGVRRLSSQDVRLLSAHRASCARGRHLTCFVNRAGELLDEWNRLRPHGFQSG
jgi:hypothetical protein